MTRIRAGKMLFGVAGGVARYLEVDPVIIRVIFVVTGFMGWGVIAYLALAVLMPVEDVAPAAPPESIRQNVQAMAADAAEAVGKAKHEGARLALDQRRATALGLVLVGIGAFILAANLGWLGFEFWATFWPVILIGIGGWLLVSKLGGKTV
jgi:phage shock protein C